ncbi:MAG: alkaline phosphatase [Clostridia bacterium]|nr:alkaline phosphatase [Clostridia bacterium]
MKNVLLKSISLIILAVIMTVSFVACQTDVTPQPTEAPATEAPTEVPTEIPVTPMEQILAELATLQFGEIKNVILYIGDGMGQNHVPATDAITGGRYDGKLAFEYLPNTAIVKTVCTEGEPDSASGGTALSTGYKGKRKQLGLNNKGEEVQNVVELAKSLGKSTGAITSESIVDATPAAFTIHSKDRSDESKIAQLQIENSVCDIIMGGGKAKYDELFARNEKDYNAYFSENNITYTAKWDDVLAWNGQGRLIATMTDDYWYFDRDMTPTLAEMTEQTIKVLSQNEKGFFLMVEGGALDEVAHNTNLMEVARHMTAFDKAIEVGLRYAYENKDTIIIVTADHNTGGLLPKAEADEYIEKHQKDNYISNDEWCWTNTGIHCVLEGERIAQEDNPDVDWSTLPYRFTTIAHTSDDVNVWAIGPGTAELMTTEKLASFHIGKFIGKALSGSEFGSTDSKGVK